MPNYSTRRLCVAPMMDWTDRHCRYLLRLISPHTLLYTEMVTTGALLHGARDRFLSFNAEEHPVALQLGGSDPDDLARCARFGYEQGYDEINLNCGCPSDRVQSGRFGACLMAEPLLIADCVAAMRSAVPIPITVKTRLGIDDLDSDEHLHKLIGTVSCAGCDAFILHARKAWLSGLSPKENRQIPPLQYERVYAAKRAFPQIQIIINGGISDAQTVAAQFDRVDGVMIGREAYQNPYFLAELEQTLFERTASPREDVVRDYAQYAARQLAAGVPLRALTRHALGLFNGMRGARGWRRVLSELIDGDELGAEVLDAALRMMQGRCRPSAKLPDIPKNQAATAAA